MSCRSEHKKPILPEGCGHTASTLTCLTLSHLREVIDLALIDAGQGKHVAWNQTLRIIAWVLVGRSTRDMPSTFKLAAIFLEACRHRPAEHPDDVD